MIKRFDKRSYAPLEITPNANKLFYKQLSGLRLLQSVATTPLVSTSDWYLNIDKVTDLIFINLKKAFDTANHALLLKKMKIYGATSLAHEWFVDNSAK